LDVGGKAVKKPNGYTYSPGLDVTATLASGEKLTLLGQVPASCHIIEEKVEVPAEYIEAHTTTRKRIVCGEEE